jgi:hypothetical protein
MVFSLSFARIVPSEFRQQSFGLGDSCLQQSRDQMEACVPQRKESGRGTSANDCRTVTIYIVLFRLCNIKTELIAVATLMYKFRSYPTCPVRRCRVNRPSGRAAGPNLLEAHFWIVRVGHDPTSMDVGCSPRTLVLQLISGVEAVLCVLPGSVLFGVYRQQLSSH